MAPPDLIAGIVWVAVALLTARRGGSTAVFAATVAITWFIADPPSFVSMWHRFALMMLLVAAPRWLPMTWVGRVVLAIELIAAVAVAPWATPLGAVLLSIAFVTAAAVEQPSRSALSWAAIVLATTAFTAPVLIGPGQFSADAINWGYAGAMIVVGLLVLGDLGARRERSQHLDLLVELESAATSSSAREREAAHRLRAKHEQLLRELDAGVAEMQSSRRRLAEARLIAARELREDLDAHVIAPLATLSARPTTDAAGGHLATAREHVDLARTDIEAISQGLGPRSLANGLTSAMEELAASSSLPISLSLDEGSSLFVDQVAARTAYLLGAEALANATKHAHATRVAVELTTSAGDLRLDVTDDGIGGADPANGTGLASLRDRVEAVAGRFTIRTDSTGTTVSACIPMRTDLRVPQTTVSSEAADG